MFSKILAVVALTAGAVAQTIVDLAVATPTLSTLVSVLTTPGYKPVLDALSGAGPFTVFAPTDAAFAAAGVDPSNVETVTKVLQYHVLSGAVPSTALQASQEVATLNGAKVTVKKSASGVTVNGANVVVADVMGSNGVVHVIDKVLLPPVASPTPKPVSPWSISPYSMSPLTLGSNWVTSFGNLPSIYTSSGSYLPATTNWASTAVTSLPSASFGSYLPSTNWASTFPTRTSMATSVPLYSGTARTISTPTSSFGSYLPSSTSWATPSTSTWSTPSASTWATPSTMNWATPATTNWATPSTMNWAAPATTNWATPATTNWATPLSTTNFGAFGTTLGAYTPAASWNFPTYTLGASSSPIWG